MRGTVLRFRIFVLFLTFSPSGYLLPRFDGFSISQLAYADDDAADG